jgi:prevent-host-death family protein
MNQVALEQLPQAIAELFQAAQGERVVITRNGRPFAIVVGVENKDEEDLEMEFSPGFWRMIDERRGQPGSVSFEEVKAQLEADEKRCPEQQAGAAKS